MLLTGITQRAWLRRPAGVDATPQGSARRLTGHHEAIFAHLGLLRIRGVRRNFIGVDLGHAWDVGGHHRSSSGRSMQPQQRPSVELPRGRAPSGPTTYATSEDATSARQSQADETLAGMSCWQYAQLTITVDGRALREDTRTIVWRGPGQGLGENYSDRDQTVLELLNRFGADGWELAGLQDYREGGDESSSYWEATRLLTIYTFKRPVPGLAFDPGCGKLLARNSPLRHPGETAETNAYGEAQGSNHKAELAVRLDTAGEERPAAKGR